MLKNILKLKGTSALSNNEQKGILGKGSEFCYCTVWVGGSPRLGGGYFKCITDPNECP